MRVLTVGVAIRQYDRRQAKAQIQTAKREKENREKRRIWERQIEALRSPYLSSLFQPPMPHFLVAAPPPLPGGGGVGAHFGAGDAGGVSLLYASLPFDMKLTERSIKQLLRF